MKRFSAGLLVTLLSLSTLAQKNNTDNTLLWKISGNGLEKPSYLFGTIHMICSQDAGLSDNMRKVISECDEVYLEVDMNNLIEMMAAVSKMKMRGDTTLKDLLSTEDYNKVKAYFKAKETLLPFSMLETYKPIVAASTLQETDLPCEETSMMEQVIMDEAKQYKKRVRGLETMSYQAGVLDSIPYKLQAEQLVQYIDKANKGETADSEFAEMFKAYKEQDLAKLEKLMVSMDAGMSSFIDILLYHRNLNWAKKLDDLLPKKSLLIAVGAGHLPGEKGMINLLRKQGYKVTPLENKVRAAREI
jgi:uncharacterized protein